MARSLSRNTKLYVSTLGPGSVGAANSTPANTFEIKVLDGYSFSQDVTNVEIGVNEAGTDPVRGTLAFNTALNPVDVSFSTYVRPQVNGAGETPASVADCIERPLWASAFGTDLAVGAGKATEAQDASHVLFGLDDSNNNELLRLYLYFVLENTTYVIEDFNVSSAEVDFSIDGIATINWSGFGSRVNENIVVHNKWTDTGDADYLVETTDYKGVPATTTTTFLRNKLSTLDVKDLTVDTPLNTDLITNEIVSISGKVLTMTAFDATTGGTTAAEFVNGRVVNNDLTGPDAYATILEVNDVAETVTVLEDISATGKNWLDTHDITCYTKTESAGVTYSIPITGATLTVENNFTYLTPEELAIVNLPLAGFAGTRVINGSFTAYLNTGAAGSGGLLQDMLNKIEASVTNNFQLNFHMGNADGTAPRVDFDINHAQVSVPTTNVEDIISTEISFTAKPWDETNSVGSFEDTNELNVDYVLA
jgi:hypothetical protein